MYTVLRIDSNSIRGVQADARLTNVPTAAFVKAAQLPWINHHYPYGYALLADGSFAGSIQSFYADRIIDGSLTTICNLSSWWVDEQHRSASMRLLFAALRDAGQIPVTALTPSGLAAQIYTGLKFSVADADRFGIPIASDGPSASGDPDDIFLRLKPDAKKVFNDHRSMTLNHCLVEYDDSYCYFMYLTRERFDLKVADLLYVDGNLELLRRGWRAPEGTPLASCDRLLVDRRFFRDLEPWGEVINPFNPRFYKGPPDLRDKIDFVYSEVPIYSVALL